MKKKAKVGITILIGLLVLGTLVYFGRGWIRGSAIPSYASLFYKPTVDKHFNDDFSNINDKLRGLGFSFASPLQDECWRGGNAMFQGFSETVPCIKQQESVPFVLTSNFISQWQLKSLEFEQYLESVGWHKEYNAQQSISGLFSVPGYDATIAVNYSKAHGKASCDLSIGYTAAQSNPNKVFVDESCERDVSFFGGSSG